MLGEKWRLIFFVIYMKKEKIINRKLLELPNPIHTTFITSYDTKFLTSSYSQKAISSESHGWLRILYANYYANSMLVYLCKLYLCSV